MNIVLAAAYNSTNCSTFGTATTNLFNTLELMKFAPIINEQGSTLLFPLLYLNQHWLRK